MDMGLVPDIDNIIIDIGAVVAALGVIGTALWTWLLKPAYEVGVSDKLDVLTERLETYAEDHAAQIEKVTSQLVTNGGSSLRDQTNRIERDLKAHIEAEKERTRILSIELKATNARVDSILHAERTHTHNRVRSSVAD